MAFYRGANVLMGMAFARETGPLVTPRDWALIAAIFGFVFLLTQIASEEPHPRRERLMRLTGALVVLLVLFNVLLYVGEFSKGVDVPWELCVLMSLAVAGVIARLLQLARRSVNRLTPESVQKLVIGGLVGTIVLNAGFVAFTGKAGPTVGVLFLLLPTFIMLRFFHLLYPGTSTAID
jgi:hypothetical protein